MGGLAVRQSVRAIARAIARRNRSGRDVVLIGIQTGGIQLARELASRLATQWKTPIPLGQLDVTLHRDDLDQRLAPKVHPTAITFDVTNKTVILVDDVLCSGRTTRAALDALHDLGRPRCIQLAVLIDRPHRELPIQADYIGQTVRTTATDRVDVQLADGNGVTKVLLEKRR